jgi:hypothetical protein
MCGAYFLSLNNFVQLCLSEACGVVLGASDISVRAGDANALEQALRQTHGLVVVLLVLVR